MPLWLVHGTHFEQQELSCWMCVHVYVFTNASVHVHNPAMVYIALSKDGLCGWIWRLEINLTSLVQPLSALIFETRSLTFTCNFNSARLTCPRDPTVSASSVLGFHEFWGKSLGKFLTDHLLALTKSSPHLVPSEIKACLTMAYSPWVDSPPRVWRMSHEPRASRPSPADSRTSEPFLGQLSSLLSGLLTRVSAQMCLCFGLRGASLIMASKGDQLTHFRCLWS